MSFSPRRNKNSPETVNRVLKMKENQNTRLKSKFLEEI